MLCGLWATLQFRFVQEMYPDFILVCILVFVSESSVLVYFQSLNIDSMSQCCAMFGECRALFGDSCDNKNSEFVCVVGFLLFVLRFLCTDTVIVWVLRCYGC